VAEGIYRGIWRENKVWGLPKGCERAAVRRLNLEGKFDSSRLPVLLGLRNTEFNASDIDDSAVSDGAAGDSVYQSDSAGVVELPGGDQ
jgi:hypothetical protein